MGDFWMLILTISCWMLVQEEEKSRPIPFKHKPSSPKVHQPAEKW